MTTGTFVLPQWTEGSLFPSPLGTLYYNDSTTPVDLTNASTITGMIRNSAGVTRDIEGTLTVSGTPTLGQVLWTLHADDVVGGRCEVQITVAFSSGQTPTNTFIADWYVERKLVVSA